MPSRPGRVVVDGGATAISGGVGGGEGGGDLTAVIAAARDVPGLRN